MRTKQKSAFADRKMLGRAMKDSFAKLSPKTQAKNPVMFLVFVSAILTSILWVVSLFGLKDAPSGYTLAIAIILWFTVLFANFAEAIAEGRGKAHRLECTGGIPTWQHCSQRFLPCVTNRCRFRAGCNFNAESEFCPHR